MTRSKKNWDHLVDYNGNYRFEFDVNGDILKPLISPLAQRRLQTIRIKPTYLTAPDPASPEANDTYDSLVSPPRGQIWVYSNPGGVLKGVTDDLRNISWGLKINSGDAVSQATIRSTTFALESRFVELYDRANGGLVVKFRLYNLEVEEGGNTKFLRVGIQQEVYGERYDLFNNKIGVSGMIGN